MALIHELLLVLCTFVALVGSFSPSFVPKRQTSLLAAASGDAETPQQQQQSDQQDDSEIQWDLFKRHHAQGSWKGIWTSYDYIGDVVDETIASVDLNLDEEQDTIQQTHTIVVGAKRSDCETCFDSMETKTLPVAAYSPTELRKSRLASIAMVNGPSLLRSGAMATELVLKHGDGRVRVVFQHAPVWEAGMEPGVGPPQGLKLFRTMVSREALRESPPTAESEAANPPTTGNPIFFRGVPPFNWHKIWGGTSWTWGPNTGNRGWSIEEMEESDAWHGRPTGDTPNVWCLRLPGGILLQGPRVIRDGEAGLCRLAWMPTDDKLLRVEASVLALEPMLTQDEEMVGFYPPSLGSLRVDLMDKLGDLAEQPVLLDDEKDIIKPQDEGEAVAAAAATAQASSSSSTQGDDDSSGNADSGLQDARDALQL